VRCTIVNNTLNMCNVYFLKCMKWGIHGVWGEGSVKSSLFYQLTLEQVIVYILNNGRTLYFYQINLR